MKFFLDTCEGLLVGIVLTFASYFVGQEFGWWDFAKAYTDSPLWLGVEVIGVVLNYACVYLVSRQKNANWPLGIVAVVFLGALAYHGNLKASMTLQWAYFIPAQFVGWYNWKFGGEGRTDLPVSRTLEPFEYIMMAIVGVVSWYIIVQVYNYFQSSYTTFDVGILMLSIIAQYLCNQKKPISWVFWAAVNVISVYVYYKSGFFLWAAQYALFLCNVVYGYTLWYLDRQRKAEPIHYGR
jgi:nicotinamide mononucleotide transporter